MLMYVIYSILNVLAVRGYGEAEFWLSGGKVILIFILFAFTFVTMVGGNPDHDAYGFRSWNTPGPFMEYLSTGPLGKFEGFLGSLWSAGFAVVGPEYISMVAAEAKRPRIFIKTAFKTIYFRFGLFFFGSAICIGIILPANDPKLRAVNGLLTPEQIEQYGLQDSAGAGTAGASPYVIAMANMGISGLPHLVNALMLTSIFSAGNTYTYCATRSLYGLALEGRAPRFLRKCTKAGVPIYCFLVVMCFPMLSYLSCGSSSSVVITWFVDLITAGGLIDFLVVGVTFICYHKACKVQGLDRKSLPYYGWFQPYGAWIALFFQSLICLFYGYTAFRHQFDVETFFKNYTMQLLAPILFFGWKLIKRTKWVKPEEVDLIWERPVIDRYEARFLEPPVGFWAEILAMFGYKKQRVRDSEAVRDL